MRFHQFSYLQRDQVQQVEELHHLGFDLQPRSTPA